MPTEECPFKVGDLVVFTPDQHPVGWYQHAWDHFRLHPGEKGKITRIDKGAYSYLGDDRGGLLESLRSNYD